MLILQIAAGVWLGGVALVVTFVIFAEVNTKIEKNHRYGYPWYRGLVWR